MTGCGEWRGRSEKHDRMLKTCRTDINTYHVRRGLAQGMFGRLRCATACNENGQLLSIRPGRPVQMVLRASSFGIVPLSAIRLQVVDRRRIGTPVIKCPDFISNGRYGSITCPLLIHNHRFYFFTG